MSSNRNTTGSHQQGGHKGGDNPMTSEDASRIQSAADRNPKSATATTGFKERAMSTAAKNEESGKKPLRVVI
ncbi:hypothetical protein BCR41DRAFT_396589 [Lobosporangium transversale]|uniref:Uncharacterized protein n=1 Tax=Lobosporangium transversale TaxID=64571 RepID=A0A1Y2GP04_9FUNG|nr:hypothetical protein BCR41DRAFT_396589 [Lobosporangium transversale]ORZ14859.1 hypothetical protein BCR41DRAFT_396589 [Lobosporangium transversale]|eukprot:XP_021880991.1 hypothetical protein BCR41DRAFT_396589 [Lobosporangium transversale]